MSQIFNMIDLIVRQPNELRRDPIEVKCPNFQTRTVNNEGDVIRAIRDAKEMRGIVRVCGSEHSPADHIIGSEEHGMFMVKGVNVQSDFCLLILIIIN